MASALPAEAVNALVATLDALAATDNTIRSNAEASLNDEWIAQRPDMLLVGLAEQTKGNAQDHMRSFAVVLLRRIAFKPAPGYPEESEKTIYDILNDVARKNVHDLLLASFAEEQVVGVRHKVCDAIAEIARHGLYSSYKWPDLLQALFSCSKSPEAAHRESAYRVFAAVPTLIGSQHADILKGAFQAGLEDQSQEVRLAALRAYCAFLLEAGSNTRSTLSVLLPACLNVLPPLSTTHDSETLATALTSLIELAETHPKMFKNYFTMIVQFGLSVIKDKEHENVARQAALELLITFCEGAPGMCRKEDSYASNLVVECLAFLTDVGAEDDDAQQEWNETEDLDADESDANHIVGEQALDRLARKLGGKTVLPPAFAYLPNMISSTNWRQRHAALMAISAIAEGCEKIMKAELSRVLDMVLPLLRDPHPRVRWAACNAVGQMSTDFANTMQAKFHERVLSGLVPVLQAPEPRVQAHAAAALVNFCEECDNATLEPYLDGILERLLALLQSPKKYVQEQAVTTIATVADAAEAKFVKYYDAIMPLLVNVLKAPDAGKEYRLLRGKAMECATLIALAVGKERFAPSAQELIQVLGSIQQSVVEADDPQASYLIPAWGRICRVMGKEFLPYLGAVMPPLLEAAKLKPDFAVLQDDEEKEKYAAEDGWEFIGVQGQQIGIKTTVLEEKCTAVEMLVCYAAELKENFQPYVGPILNDIVIPSLKFYFHDGVRSAAAKCIPRLLDSIKLAGADVKSVWDTVAQKITDIIKAEPAAEMVAEFFSAWNESVEVVGAAAISAEQLAAFITASESQIQDYGKRTEARAEAAHSGDVDIEEDDDVMMEMEDDEAMLAEMSKAFHMTFKTINTAFLPHWERLLPYIGAFLNHPEQSSRQWGVGCIDDLIEFCGPESLRYSSTFLEPLGKGLTDPAPEVRQASTYGVGAAAQFGGEAYADFCAAALPALFQCIQIAGARDDENIYATENACAAIAKILRFNSSKVQNLDQTVVAWIQTLPIICDDEEAPYAYSFLSELIEQNHPAVTSQVPVVFKAIVEGLEAAIMTEKVKERVVGATKQLMSTTPDASALVSSLTVEQQQLMQKLFA
ncbi:ARM repeat-containing protein [Saitoella complicata NRRL Y-17804]|uniref:ARM repeat-containing protein n=1 Tax=Saitoella complicata (strain BCRC 22490 / CBS 7301 / JCM 7358 / NBRC 10748 / NRRL Y-17804) TaxID=698492 RepID=UPI000867C5BE|nr:ARM repeat-containing protein [Saitoella complicata NRRL Y-17804]ODQ56549.1 ARM repeat-containing protein [Saitoella complicata NRRL Y-17804]